MPIGKTAEARKRQREYYNSLHANQLQRTGDKTKERARARKVPLTLPSVGTPTLAEIEAKYGK